MSSYVIFAQDDRTCAGLKAWLELIGANARKECVVASADKLKIFEEGEDCLRGALAEGNETTVLVDSVRWAGLDPLGTGWDSALAALILGFPEARWIFGVLGDAGVKDNTMAVYRLSSLFGVSAPDPLMDGNGLREHVRGLARRSASQTANYLPERRSWAAALDDEKSYAYFNAYTAYRHGLRAFPLRDQVTTESLFGRGGIGDTIPGNLSATFEDVFLNFPDRDEQTHYSDLSNSREISLPGLCKADWRIFVSSSQTQIGSDERRRQNAGYIKGGANAREGAREVHKPLSGMFDLWEKSRLKERLSWAYIDPSGRERCIRGRGPSFLWPPPLDDPKRREEAENTGHGSPGMLLMVAENLIHRADWLIEGGIHSVAEAVRGAVLATDALELLGDRTPTTAIDALGLKHRFEILAECQFSGVEYHLRIKERLSEIKAETQILAGWFNPKEAKGAGMNAEMFILNHLVAILREYNQFDEEQICMARVRQLHNRLWRKQRPALRPILYPFMTYAEVVLRSFPHFVLAVLLWVVGLGLLFWLAMQYWGMNDHGQSLTIPRAFSDAATTFFSAQPPGDDSFWKSDQGFNGAFTLILLAQIAGFVHLGIFISHLYSLVVRK